MAKGSRNATTFAKGTHGGAKGAGWGGPAKGAGEPFSAENQPHYKALKEGHVEGKAFREMLAPHKQEVADTWLEVLRDKSAPPDARIKAGEKIALFSGEAPASKSSVELTGQNGAPLMPTLSLTIRNE